MQEHRHHTRQPLSLPARLRIGADTHPVWIRDISLKGVLVECTHPVPDPSWLDRHAHIQILSDPELIPLIELDVTVIRVRAKCIGAAWQKIELDDLIALRQLLTANLANEQLIERELLELYHDE
ncbi:MAG: PilZ domain-containing protein [Halothiobacillus sp.]|jgi:hypothetical protein|nr:PilZ domain-containing protein [Halothiobacillus sp.]